MPDERVHPPEPAAKDDEPRVQDIDESGRSEAEPSTDVIQGSDGSSGSVERLDQAPVSLGSAAAHRMTPPDQQDVLADLRLPAADGAATTGRPVRVDRQVPDLAAVAGGAR